jgi:foldase protein PrsA
MSSPIYTYKGVGIAQLEKVEIPRQANFEEVEEEVKQGFATIRKKEKALEKMKKVKAELKEASLEGLAEKHGLEYNTANEHKRGQYLSVIGENTKIDELAFSLPLNEESEPVEFEEGYALIKLEKDKETEKENLLGAKKNKFFQSYMSKLREEKKVKIKYDLFLKINSDVLSRYGGEG